MPLVQTFTTPDGKRRLNIYAHESGFFSFTETTEARLDHPDLPEEKQTYWKIVLESGLYETSEAAEDDARKMTPWLIEK
jgi:hypothetical protein